MIDVAVAGGGPVGLGAALYAHRAGLDVTVFEPRTGAIDKACGEGLMPGAVGALADLGIDPPGHPLRGIRYIAGDRYAEADFRHGLGRGVRRTTLHDALGAAVAAAGIPVVRHAVMEVVQDGASVRLDGTCARYLLAADGLHSPMRRLLRMDDPVQCGQRFGLRCHAEIAPWTDHVEVHWSDLAEAYVTPVGPRLVGVALLTSSRGTFDELLAGFPVIRERMAGATRSRVRGAGPLRQRSRRRVAGRVLLVGDASGYVDALTGEGIALGLAQARAAVAAILAGRPETYEASWQRVTWRYRLLTAALLRASRLSPVRRSIVPAAARLPRVFAAAVNELARPA
ncbi:MAG: NAD(P)/FAD-dependent oxidoreductase [Actinomycetota bacterium]|nr:NAD(P)/FAD-dependent oxidoreductase [Actinomycetota bacterium]